MFSLEKILGVILFVFLLKRTGLLHRVYFEIRHWVLALFMFLLTKAYNEAIKTQKLELFTHINSNILQNGGKIYELGCGSGGSLEFYTKDCSVKLTAIEPNTNCETYLIKNLKKYGNIKLDKIVFNKGEDMKDIESNSVDCLVSTLALCAVDDQEKVFQEIKRVLKKGGRFYFLEHGGAAKHTWIYWIKCKLNPIFNCLTDTLANILNRLEKAEFSELEFVHFDAVVPPFMVARSHVYGWVEK